MYIDDDLPKEGELLDITKKKSKPDAQSSQIQSSSEPTKIPFGLIIGLILLALAAFASKVYFNHSGSDEQIAAYQQGVQSTIGTMKGQFPYLESVLCNDEDPVKPDCTSFIASFVPDKNSAVYQSSMDTIDKAVGATETDINSFKIQMKALVDNKRASLPSMRKPIIVLIESTTVPKVGEPFKVKTRCTESQGDTIVCEPVK